ncbi:membrane protein insertase YidC [Schinkia sp. CFF1]
MDFFQHYFVQTFSYLIKFFAHEFHDNYGISIILLTILIRCILVPVTINQQRSQVQMKKIQPKIQELRTKYSPQDREGQMKLQQEMMLLYKEHDINPVKTGCLPLIIQMPILMGFYYAIRGTKEIATHSFLWFHLGLSDPVHILPFIAAFTTFLQTKMLNGTINSGNANTKIMMFVMPIMILFFAQKAPAALVLYWITGNVFYLLQHYVLSLKYVRKVLSLENEG